MPNYEEFVDPNSAIARIIQQMQGAANRSNPDLPPGGAQPPGIQGEMQYPMSGTVQGEMGPEDPNELIARLLSGQVNR
jgi:hypothetical protein